MCKSTVHRDQIEININVTINIITSLTWSKVERGDCTFSRFSLTKTLKRFFLIVLREKAIFLSHKHFVFNNQSPKRQTQTLNKNPNKNP